MTIPHFKETSTDVEQRLVSEGLQAESSPLPPVSVWPPSRGRFSCLLMLGMGSKEVEYIVTCANYVKFNF